MEKSRFKAVSSGNTHTYTLEDGREAVFRVPVLAMLEPVFEITAGIPDKGTMPDSFRNVVIMEAAGAIIGYLWADSAFRLSANWRTAGNMADYGSAVVEELRAGLDGYEPWAVIDFPGCLKELSDVLRATLPSEAEVVSAVDFTEPMKGVSPISP